MTGTDKPTQQIIKDEALQESKDAKTRTLLLVLMLLLVTLAAVTGLAGYIAYDKINERAESNATSASRAEREANEASEASEENRKAAEELIRQVESLGEKPRVTSGQLSTPPRTTQGAQGVAGARGPGPTFSEVLQASRQVLPQALSVNCGGSCEGSPGADGTNGTNGEKGDKGDRGEKGETGSQGPPGRDAPVPTSASCSGGIEQFSITFTYSDGSTISVTCGANLPPVEEPEPQPEATATE